MRHLIKNAALVVCLALVGFVLIPAPKALAQMIDCELVKWPRADADAHAAETFGRRFNPLQQCRNNLPPASPPLPAAGWQDSQTPQPTAGFECERRSCFQHYNEPMPRSGAQDYGLTCVYFPCQEQDVIICDNRGCNPINGTAEPDPAIGAPSPCVGCEEDQCKDAARILRENHENFERAIMSTISEEMRKERIWMREVFFKSEILKALAMFTNQMSAVAMQQMFMVGQFLDAKNEMETWRTFQYLQHQAHRDYTPSNDFCWFGTNVRSLAASEKNSMSNSYSLSRLQMARALGKPGTPGAQNRGLDLAARWQKFTNSYCDPEDNSWTRNDTGLSMACGTGAPRQSVNIDIDYNRLIDKPHTLDNIDFTNGADTDDEKNILALSQNLYGHNPLSRSSDQNSLKVAANQYLYLTLRSIQAKRSVAENSFNTIVGLKSKGSAGMTGAPNTSAYLYAILKELGMREEDIKKTIGSNPSYYAQLEILAKNIYQNPDFYANLYDKPANVQRKSVALRAIERMVDQALLESQLRQEMLISVLTSSKLRKQDRKVSRELSGAK